MTSFNQKTDNTLMDHLWLKYSWFNVKGGFTSLTTFAINETKVKVKKIFFCNFSPFSLGKCSEFFYRFAKLCENFSADFSVSVFLSESKIIVK